MIDEILTQFEWSSAHGVLSKDTKEIDGAKAEALTAIYEIGLECIGADEEIRLRTGDLPEDPRNEHRNIRNHLRASQRKAWAKACGVAE